MAAGDGTAAVGGGIGGALGNVIGQQMGGSTGAAVGAGVGGAAGGALGAGKGNKTEAAIGGGLGSAGGSIIGNQLAEQPDRRLEQAWVGLLAAQWVITWAIMTAVVDLTESDTATKSINTIEIQGVYCRTVVAVHLRCIQCPVSRGWHPPPPGLHSSQLMDQRLACKLYEKPGPAPGFFVTKLPLLL
jgi:hypothetical protein